MKFAHEIQAYGEASLRLLFPAACDLCQTVLTLREKSVCKACRDSLESLLFPFEKRSIDQSFTFIDHAWALYPYSRQVKEILTQVKFYGKRWLLELFKKPLSEWTEGVSAETHYDKIIPIPLDRERLLIRQFNQSGIIAELIGRSLRIPTAQRLLKKSAPTLNQSHLTRSERRLNLSGVFKIPKRNDLFDKSILLVDDILTTGATAEEAAQVLKTTGATQVDIIVIAYTERAQ